MLLGRDPASGRWSMPAFFSMGSASIGLQVGAQASEIILMVMTDAYAVMAGLDGIAFPADGAVAVAGIAGRPFHQAHACCSIKLGTTGATTNIATLASTSCAA